MYIIITFISGVLLRLFHITLSEFLYDLLVCLALLCEVSLLWTILAGIWINIRWENGSGALFSKGVQPIEYFCKCSVSGIESGNLIGLVGFRTFSNCNEDDFHLNHQVQLRRVTGVDSVTEYSVLCVYVGKHMCTCVYVCMCALDCIGCFSWKNYHGKRHTLSLCPYVFTDENHYRSF